MKNTILLKLCFVLFLASIVGCDKEQEIQYPDVQIGKPAVSEVTLNKETEKRLIVSGGNGKYIVNIEDSKIATAKMSADTLKVKGLFEGETFLTVISQDKRERLKVNVIYAELGVSQSTIDLQPGIKNKTISISGGGDGVKIEKNDPFNVLDFKWDGASGMLEINPKYEGKAEIIVTSEDGKDKKVINVNIKPEGELNSIGCYGTTSSTYFTIVNNKMVVNRKGVGTLIANSARPYGGYSGGSYKGTYVQIAPVVKPVKGDVIDVEVLDYVWDKKEEITVGKHSVVVEEVNETTVLLLGKGFKFLLPYEK